MEKKAKIKNWENVESFAKYFLKRDALNVIEKRKNYLVLDVRIEKQFQEFLIKMKVSVALQC